MDDCCWSSRIQLCLLTMASQKQRDELPKTLVTMQMEMIGMTFEDAMNTPEWWRVYSITTEQEEEFKKKALPLIKKVLRCNKTVAEKTLSWFLLDLGLRKEDK